MSWLSVAWHWYSAEAVSSTGAITHPHADIVNPMVAFVGAAVVAWAALRQAATASKRHREQTKADQQRRITESFSRAVEQLGSDKLEVRLGGIYSLERISKESPDDYWTVMEILTAFVRERSRRTDLEKIGEAPSTDIDAVLTVIKRRSEGSRDRERNNNWQLDFEGAVLRNARLGDTHLERAWFGGAHLEGANFSDAYLEETIFFGAHLERAWFRGAHLEGASLDGAHLDGAYLEKAKGLTEAQLAKTHGSGSTTLPEGMRPPAEWRPD